MLDALRPRGGAPLHAAEARFDLGDPELAAPAQEAVSLFDEVDPVGAHEGEAEDGDVDGGVGEREVGDVGGGDERVRGVQVEAEEVEVKLRRVRGEGLGEFGVAAAEVGDGAEAVCAGEGG